MLHSIVQGKGKNLVILHGLFGNSKNWTSLAKTWSHNFCVHRLDALNHGKSAAHENMNYATLTKTIIDYLEQKNIKSTFLLGHSMGGKTAMQVANMRPDLVEKLIILDITNQTYAPHHNLVLQALEILASKTWQNRQQSSQALKNIDLDLATKNFLLADLTRQDDGNLQLQMNFANIKNNYVNIMDNINFQQKLNMPCLLVSGSLSNYVDAQNIQVMQAYFSNLKHEQLKAGHWLHQERQAEVAKLVLEFLQE